MKKYFGILIVFLLMLSLVSCGGKKGSNNYDSDNYDSGDSLVYSTDRKIIYTVSYDYKNNMDEIKNEKKEIRKYVIEIGGYIESSSEYNDGKNCYYRYKVPTDKLNDFIEFIDDDDNYYGKSTTTKDVTSGYDITEDQINNIKLRIQTYQNMLSNPDLTYDEIREIDNRIDDLTYQLNNLEARQSMIDSAVNYSTVSINYHYKDTSNQFVKILLNLLIYFGVLLMILAPFGIVGFVIFLIIRKKKRSEA